MKDKAGLIETMSRHIYNGHPLPTIKYFLP